MKEQSTGNDRSKEPPPTLDEVWRLFGETDRQIKENAQQFRETGQRFKETDHQFKETDRKFQETDHQFKETDRKFQETDRQFKETDRKFQETDRQFKATDRKLNRLERLFTGHWGKLMESLVEGGLVNILNRRGIEISNTTSRLRGQLKDGGNYEFDIIAHNGDEIVVVEVKTTLRPDDVTRFLDKLSQLKKWVPRYADNSILGAMAYLTANAGADAMAADRGLFIIRATGDSAAIVNSNNFQPRSW